MFRFTASNPLGVRGVDEESDLATPPRSCVTAEVSWYRQRGRRTASWVKQGTAAGKTPPPALAFCQRLPRQRCTGAVTLAASPQAGSHMLMQRTVCHTAGIGACIARTSGCASWCASLCAPGERASRWASGVASHPTCIGVCVRKGRQVHIMAQSGFRHRFVRQGMYGGTRGGGRDRFSIRARTTEWALRVITPTMFCS